MPRGRQVTDLSGKKFGRLTVLSRAENSKSGSVRWNCLCECGGKATVHGVSLRAGRTQSCGCYQKEQTGNANRTHGETDRRLYTEWAAMKARCYNPRNKRYDRYGGRGIAICDEWRESYETFRNWALANGYRDDLTIERNDTDGDYCPENCKWATQKEQQNNRSNNVKIDYHGETMSMKQWAERVGMEYSCLYARLNRGWTFERAISTPSRAKKSKELGL